MKRKKLLSAAVLVIVLAIVGGVAWILLGSQQPELSIQEQVRDAAMAYIKGNHPETTQFMDNLVWTGGRVTPEGLVGGETYTYLSPGWNVTITYPVVPNPKYNITVDYSAPPGASVPYRVFWQGYWEDAAIVELNYTFTQ